ncbi:prephenate dehydratase [Rufibacter immobilis]|uniref:prephenate dehydratase n=1 Tax=Rufibacter immobilis TaxID=1348778 RepID=A0A3M9MQX4_9BACT|nr:prephenate dehydratase domain-containing protein [Rufibacter immobilis]RNI27906.1 prephenate dehydratase [Rufibacter immobilis]
MNRTLKIAIQGGPASFHETAAEQLFPAENIHTLSCASFPELCQTLESGQADFAVMAVQNSLAGPLLPNYSLVAQHGFSILAERWLLLDQTLMALPGQRLADIEQVWSHPIALLQCSEFIHTHPRLSTKETSDTADTARLLREGSITGVAAIASRKAAQLYGLEVLEANVANDTENYTRFVVLSRQAKAQEANKLTCVLPSPTEKELTDILLKELEELNLELTMLQTLPAHPSDWVLEVEADDAAAISNLRTALIVADVPHQVLGLYAKAVTPLPQDRLAGCLSAIVQPQIELV